MARIYYSRARVCMCMCVCFVSAAEPPQKPSRDRAESRAPVRRALRDEQGMFLKRNQARPEKGVNGTAGTFSIFSKLSATGLGLIRRKGKYDGELSMGVRR